MIVVDDIDLGSGRARLEICAGEDGTQERLAELALLGVELGLASFEVRGLDAGVRTVHLAGPTTTAAPAMAVQAPPRVWLRHRVERDGTILRYAARFPHQLQSCRRIRAYTEFALRAGGVARRDVSLVRLVIYELCVNAIEHGTPLIENPEIEIGFDVDAGSVRGWVRDRCTAFDPVSFQSTAVTPLSPQPRRRGHGLRMVRRAVDSLHHTHDGHGNFVSFNKERNDEPS